MEAGDGPWGVKASLLGGPLAPGLWRELPPSLVLWADQVSPPDVYPSHLGRSTARQSHGNIQMLWDGGGSQLKGWGKVETAETSEGP